MTISTQELETLMRDSAQDAIRFAQEEFSVELDSSASSVAQVDKLILLIRSEYSEDLHDSKLIFTVCNMLGAYVGEVFRRFHGGQWVYDDSDKDAPAVFLALGEYTFAFAGMVYQRLLNDGVISIEQYYLQAEEGAGKNH
ncbi:MULTISPECIES: hypothetical protein [Gammaproteobacteria]|uniref:hypothetical protein n=1 Tax=Gammaproteobacteria TaxID=1236 RepID=UPI000DD04DE3|nr:MULTISPECIES: hypothetical protein [Gammaproteobacteria]RTE86153.1 hypothetical protein DQX04_06165 [Aliidiomarina sp. B3213]TCZ91505.1 hypothetical protein EYQ95_06175 [Lysobacter sp. N42]